MTLWRATGTPNGASLWIEDDGTNPYRVYGDHPGSVHHPHGRDRSLRKSVERLLGPNGKLTRTKLNPGEYHPRIWSDGPHPHASQFFEHEWSSAMLGAKNLFVGMREVFRHVEPVKENFKAYGHEIRHLLVLACNEIEAQCKAVLRANSYAKTSHWNMRDYSKLAKPMRLAEWSANLIDYPALGSIQPFRTWSTTKNFRLLSWYSAYNAVKHDREVEFKRANIGHLVEAMAAVYIMVVAQFGQFGRHSFNYQERNEFGVRWPRYHPSQHYPPPHLAKGTDWHPVPYQF